MAKPAPMSYNEKVKKTVARIMNEKMTIPVIQHLDLYRHTILGHST